MSKIDAKKLEELKKKLSTEQYNICFLAGTEPPFSGKFTHNTAKGTYVCAVCRTPLFSSAGKFDSGTGWPSFDEVIKKGNVVLKQDDGMGLVRTEVQCATCSAHLGHLFADGPTKTGNRYCINSLALEFVKIK